MQNQLKTIREALEAIDNGCQANNLEHTLAALTQLEAMVGEQEPAAWGAFHESGRAVIYQDRATVESFDLDGTPVEPLYRGPVAQQYEAGDMASAAAQGFRDGVASVAQQPQSDDYKGWYDEAMCASNEAGFVGLSAAQTIKALSDEVAELKHTQAEHDLKDVRCECCGYMTHHREHMGCIRAASKQPQAEAVPSDVVRDAERYRKLRTFHWSESSMCVVLDPKKSVLLGAICPSGTNLDDCVDAAIAQQKGGV